MQQTYSRRRLQSIITCSSAQSAVKHLIVLIWLEDVLGSTKPGKWDTSNVAFAWSLVFYDFFIISIKHIYKNDHFLFKHLGTYQYLKKHEARHRFEQVWKKNCWLFLQFLNIFFSLEYWQRRNRPSNRRANAPASHQRGRRWGWRL